MKRQIVAMGEMALDLNNLLLIRYFLKQARAGRMIDGLADDDGAALHYVNGRLLRAVASRRRAHAWRVRRLGRRAVETRIPAVLLGKA